MIYGVLSDVHGNLEALEAALTALKEAKAQAYICCGDVVGYGPDPHPCVDRLLALPKLYAVIGNHDLGALGQLDLKWFNPYARTAAIWTKAHLSEPARSFLSGLPLRIEREDFTVVHGTPRDPAEEYLLSVAQFSDTVSRVRAWPLFIGHSHMPLCFRPRKDVRERYELIFLEPGEEIDVKSIVGAGGPVALNPGSVGQPRDHDPRASFGLYDSERGVYRSLRAEYDLPAVQRKIREAGLPEYLALRLAYGQ